MPKIEEYTREEAEIRFGSSYLPEIRLVLTRILEHDNFAVNSKAFTGKISVTIFE